MISATDLVLGYGSQVALDSSSFSIPRGAITVVIGPNGSGKSTLLNGISGLIAPFRGSISVEASQERVSYVLQTTKVNEALPVTVREVVTMGRYATRRGRLDDDDNKAVATAMSRLDIDSIAERHLHELSGGQRQRVFVAQGLAQDHDVLLLDEPLTGIDLPTAQAIDHVIHDEIDDGCAVVMTSHDLAEAQAADHVLLLSGRVVASGPPTEVLTAENLITAYGGGLHHIEDGRIFIDDPAHQPVPGRHRHQERSIHTEGSPTELHADD